jgi:hypothetical protein
MARDPASIPTTFIGSPSGARAPLPSTPPAASPPRGPSRRPAAALRSPPSGMPSVRRTRSAMHAPSVAQWLAPGMRETTKASAPNRAASLAIRSARSAADPAIGSASAARASAANGGRSSGSSSSAWLNMKSVPHSRPPAASSRFIMRRSATGFTQNTRMASGGRCRSRRRPAAASRPAAHPALARSRRDRSNSGSPAFPRSAIPAPAAARSAR